MYEHDCNAKKCFSMTAGEKHEYLWADGRTILKPMSIPAPDYIDYLMTWMDYELNIQLDEASNAALISGKSNGRHSVTKTIIKRIIRVFAHMEIEHEQEMKNIGIYHRHERILKHYVELVNKYKLTDRKVLNPLRETIKSWSSLH